MSGRRTRIHRGKIYIQRPYTVIVFRKIKNV